MTDKFQSVLIAEDDPYFQQLLINFLTPKSNKIHAFFTGDEALKFLMNNEPHLIILDQHLHGNINGLDILRTYQQAHPDVPIIIISGKNNLQSLEDESIDSGAYTFITKGSHFFVDLTSTLEQVKQSDLTLKQKLKEQAFLKVITIVLICLISIQFIINN
jgi:DNA-binding NtrC family response regulator